MDPLLNAPLIELPRLIWRASLGDKEAERNAAEVFLIEIAHIEFLVEFFPPGGNELIRDCS